MKSSKSQVSSSASSNPPVDPPVDPPAAKSPAAQAPAAGSVAAESLAFEVAESPATVAGSTPTATPGARRFGTAWLALAVAVGLLLGYVAGLLTPSLRAPGDASAEAGFARDMAIHHGQAVQMGMIAYQKATDAEVREVAYDIVTNQQGQIGIMKRWLEEWELSPNSSRPKMAWMPEGAEGVRDGVMPGMATQEEMDRLRAATGEDVDVLFVQLMLRHHLGGIHMIDGLLERSDRPEVVQLATIMKNGQQAEVAMFRHLLEKFNAQPL